MGHTQDVKKKILASILSVVVSLSVLVIFPASATSSWYEPRPSTYRIYNETIGNSHTDGVASIEEAIHIVDYVESPDPEFPDILRLRVSASANTRGDIYYDWWSWSYNWYTVNSPAGITGDDAGVNLTLPFSVLYYGVEYNYVWVCSNGFLSFDSQSTNPNPESIPNTNEPNSLVAPFWRDLEIADGSIKYGLIDGAPQLFVISWNNVRSKSNGALQTFQVVIRGRSQADITDHNWILFQYQSITADSLTTIGLENQIGNKGISYTLGLYNGLSLKFAYPSEGYRLSQLKITLSKGSDGNAMIEFWRLHIGGYNVLLVNTTDREGGYFVDAVTFVAGLALGEVGVIFETYLILMETAGVLSSGLSPPFFQIQDAGPSVPEAWVEAATYEEGMSIRPFDATLAAALQWEFTDLNNMGHSLTITSEANYIDLYSGNPFTISTSSTLSMYIESGGGGGHPHCPFVSVWDGTSFMADNNVLPASVVSHGADVEDYYRLEKTPVQTNGKYSFLLSEFANDHSYIDRVNLMAIGHEADVRIAIAPNGEILTYKNPTPPISAADNYGNNRLNAINSMNGNLSDPATYFQGYPDDYLVLNFGQVNSTNAKLILRDDQKKAQDPCILVQVKNSSGLWQTVDVVIPRAYWSIESVNLSPYEVQGQELWVRLYWQQPHRVDYVGLDTTPPTNYDIQQGNLVSATHSTQGDVKALLTQNDNQYAEILPGQQIQLEFTLPNNSKPARTYIFYSKGHYEPITP